MGDDDVAHTALAQVADSQDGHVLAAGRTAGDGDEIRIATEVGDIGAHPGDCPFDVDDVGRPGIARAPAVVDGDADPAEVDHSAHQRIGLSPFVVDRPGAAGHLDEDRRAVALEVGIQNSGFGLALVIGAGGILVELLKDSRSLLLPTTDGPGTARELMVTAPSACWPATSTLRRTASSSRPRSARRQPLT